MQKVLESSLEKICDLLLAAEGRAVLEVGAPIVLQSTSEVTLDQSPKRSASIVMPTSVDWRPAVCLVHSVYRFRPFGSFDIGVAHVVVSAGANWALI